MRLPRRIGPGLLVSFAVAVTPAAAAAQEDAGVDGSAGQVLATPDAGIEWQLADGGALETGDGGATAAVQADLLPEELRPELTVTVDPETGLVTGDVVTITITAEAAEGDEINLPRQDFAPFDLFESESTDEERPGGRKRITFTLQLLAFEPGEHELTIRLRVLTADGTLGAVMTDPIAIEIGSLIGNEPDADLKPPSEPVQVLEEDYTLAWILGGIGALLLVALIAFFVARWWLRREKPEAPPPPPRPPWEVAIEELDELKLSLSSRVAQGDAEPWADDLSDVVRQYLGDRYEFEGLESTSDEVLARLRKLRPRGLQVEEVSALLGDCDLVKFARADATESHCQELLAAAYRIVRTTTPARSFAEPTTTKPSPAGGAS